MLVIEGNPVVVTDGTNNVTVKPASTLPVATDTALAVTLRDAALVNQGLAAALSAAWPVELTDGTNVLGTSAHPIRIDPTGTTNQPVNLAQVGGTATITGGTAGSQGVGGLAASGTAVAGNPVLMAGSDGTDARSILTDTSGRQEVVGAAAAGSAVAGNPVLMAGSDGTDARTLSTDTSGHAIIVGDGTAGTPAGGVVSIQGVAGGTNVPVSQGTTPWADNLTQVGGTNVVTGGVAGSQGVGGLAAPGAAVAGNPVLVAGSDGTDARTLSTDTSGHAIVVGGAATGAVPVGNPVLVAGFDGTDVRDISTDTSGRLIASLVDGQCATYSAALTGAAVISAATDVFTIAGSASKTIRVTRLSVTGTTTTSAGTLVNLSLVKRSVADTGGTPTTLTSVPHDSNDAAATATVLSYATGNPTLGAAVGTVRSEHVAYESVGVDTSLISWQFGDRPGARAIVLRGAAQQLAVNLGGTSLTGGIVSIDVEWTEE